jgi:hypothetical protein
MRHHISFDSLIKVATTPGKQIPSPSDTQCGHLIDDVFFIEKVPG